MAALRSYAMRLKSVHLQVSMYVLALLVDMCFTCLVAAYRTTKFGVVFSMIFGIILAFGGALHYHFYATWCGIYFHMYILYIIDNLIDNIIDNLHIFYILKLF